jgi:predicted TIM-barrel fold metal-dependent hydrolase
VAEEREPPRQFQRPWVPPLVLSAARALRRRHARGPRLGLYAPISTLDRPEHVLAQASVPAINFHSHLGRWLADRGEWMEPDVGRLLELMDSCNFTTMVNLDGRWGRELEENLARYDQAYPGRFYTFCHLDWALLEDPSGPELLVKSLQRSVAAGARGLKIWKDLGTTVRVHGRLVLPDDPLLAPVWEEAGALGIPVLVHVADPVAFFLPADRHNERLEELLRYPGNSRQPGGLDEFHRLIGSLENAIASHPGTVIVAAHGLYAENLARLSEMLGRYPNFHIDIAWAHLQLGRQPRAANALLNTYPDRVLFGTDVFPLRAGICQVYFRFLETDDESFSYTDEPVPGSGRWPIYGLGLAPATLEQIYRDNAARLLGLAPPKGQVA